MKNRQIKCVLDIHATVGECPVWSVTEQALYFEDILKPAIYRFHPASNQCIKLPMPEHIGCFGLREQGGFIGAMRSGVMLFDSHGKFERTIASNPCEAEKCRFNDGRVDPWGRFWCGTMWEPRDANKAVLCRVDADHTCRVMIDDIMISNGVAFSPDKRWMYHADTRNYVVYRYPLDEQGNIGPRQVFKTFKRPEESGYIGRPDGAATDSEGCYWVAMMDGGRVVCFSPEGELLEEIAMPVRTPTMVAFGGPALKTLYITSLSENRSAEELAQHPQSGGLFSVELDVAGLAEPLFKG